MESLFCCLKLFFCIHLAFVKLEELVTAEKCEKFSTFSKRLNFLRLELALIGDHLSLGSREEFFFVTVVKSLLQISIAFFGCFFASLKIACSVFLLDLCFFFSFSFFSSALFWCAGFVLVVLSQYHNC